jgi:hypothetical protein
MTGSELRSVLGESMGVEPEGFDLSLASIGQSWDRVALMAGHLSETYPEEGRNLVYVGIAVGYLVGAADALEADAKGPTS